MWLITHASEENRHSLQAQLVPNVVRCGTLTEINLLQVRIPSQKNTRARKMHSPRSGCYNHVTSEIWLVCQTVWGGGQNAPLPNLPFSSQMPIKLGKGILWVEIFTNWQKVLMTSSSYWFYGVIKMRQLKSGRFSRVFAKYLKNCSTSFHQTYVIFKQSSMASFEIKRLKTGHSLLPWSKRRKVAFFLKFRIDTAFWVRFEVRIPKLHRTPNFSLIHPNTRKQWRFSTLLVVATSKWRLWRHTFELEMTLSKFL